MPERRGYVEWLGGKISETPSSGAIPQVVLIGPSDSRLDQSKPFLLQYFVYFLRISLEMDSGTTAGRKSACRVRSCLVRCRPRCRCVVDDASLCANTHTRGRTKRGLQQKAATSLQITKYDKPSRLRCRCCWWLLLLPRYPQRGTHRTPPLRRRFLDCGSKITETQVAGEQQGGGQRAHANKTCVIFGQTGGQRSPQLPQCLYGSNPVVGHQARVSRRVARR